MHRPHTLRLLLCAVAVVLLAHPGIVAAQEPPVGFTDGVPVGGDDPQPSAVAPPGGVGDAEAAAITQRYFGRGPYDAMRAAVLATARPCTISDDGLTALVLAPVFKESSAATTPSSAPAPMTLSRYDEWSGTYGTTNNRDANYGLYAFRDPYTPYQRAYWHPGIGIWQYDSAGVGAPFTTIESMHAGVVAADVAEGVADRYCDPSAYYSAPFSDQERRNAAWAPWGLPCTLCQQYFDEMVTSVPKLSNIHMVDGIDVLGGVVQRTCVIAGTSGTTPCWYVSPTVGTIQGYTGWATFSPDGGGDPTVAPAPLSLPFYVVEGGTYEDRHWVKDDTGYPISISARRLIGKNARPRSNQTGSGLAWSNVSGLCDLTTPRGDCDARPPSSKQFDILSVGGDYQPLVGDVDGNGREDVLWYAPGSAPDYLWRWSGSGFSSLPLSVGGDFEPSVGDVDGNGTDDILWYAPGSAPDYLWRWNGSGFSSLPLSVGGAYEPVAGDYDGNGGVDILWYAAGPGSDYLWRWNGGGFSSTGLSITGVHQPLVGDYDGNGRAEIVWYGAGSESDHLWRWTGSGFTSSGLTVGGAYRPAVSDVDGDGRADIVWYGPGSASDYLWRGAASGFATSSLSIGGDYQPLAADVVAGGGSELIWYAVGTAPDYLWQWTGAGFSSSALSAITGDYVPVIGPLDATPGDDILWYGPGTTLDPFWYG